MNIYTPCTRYYYIIILLIINENNQIEKKTSCSVPQNIIIIGDIYTLRNGAEQQLLLVSWVYCIFCCCQVKPFDGWIVLILYNWMDNLWLKWKTLWQKEKLLVLSNFFFSRYVFKKLSAAEASERVYMREMVYVLQLKSIINFIYLPRCCKRCML